MVSSQLNVFAGVLTNDFYRPWINPDATGSQLVKVGRLFTAILGIALIITAILVPSMGGSRKNHHLYQLLTGCTPAGTGSLGHVQSSNRYSGNGTGSFDELYIRSLSAIWT